MSCFGCPSRMFLPLICAWCAGILQESHSRFFSFANHCSRYLLRLQLCRIGNHPRPVTIHGCCPVTKLSKPCPYTSLEKCAKTQNMFSLFYMREACAGKNREVRSAHLTTIVNNKKNIQKSYFYLFILISTYILA